MDPTIGISPYNGEDWQTLFDRANGDLEEGINFEKISRVIKYILYGTAVVSFGALIYGVRNQFVPLANAGLVGVIACPILGKGINSFGRSLNQTAERDTWILLHNRHQKFISELGQITNWTALSKLWEYTPRQLEYSKIMPLGLASKIDGEVRKWRALEAQKERYGVLSKPYAAALQEIGKMNLNVLITEFRQLRNAS